MLEAEASLTIQNKRAKKLVENVEEQKTAESDTNEKMPDKNFNEIKAVNSGPLDLMLAKKYESNDFKSV